MDPKFNTKLTDTAPKKKSTSVVFAGVVLPETNRVLPLVKVEVFTSSKMRSDQAAGFVAWAKLNKLGPRTIPEWTAVHEAFLQRPV